MAQVSQAQKTQFEGTQVRFHPHDAGVFLLRLTLGGLMLFHGMSKLIGGTDQITKLVVSAGLPGFFSLGVFLGEIVAPVMLILGYKVRLAGFLLAFDMIAAIILVHSAQIFQISPIGGWMLELNAFYLFGAIAVMLLGSGRYAVSKGQGLLDQ